MNDHTDVPKGRAKNAPNAVELKFVAPPWFSDNVQIHDGLRNFITTIRLIDTLNEVKKNRSTKEADVISQRDGKDACDSKEMQLPQAA